MSGACREVRRGFRCQRLHGHRWHYNAELGQEWDGSRYRDVPRPA